MCNKWTNAIFSLIVAVFAVLWARWTFNNVSLSPIASSLSDDGVGHLLSDPQQQQQHRGHHFHTNHHQNLNHKLLDFPCAGKTSYHAVTTHPHLCGAFETGLPVYTSEEFSWLDRQECPRLELLSEVIFMDHFVKKNFPTMISTREVDTWPAISKWSVSYFDYQDISKLVVPISILPMGETESLEQSCLWNLDVNPSSQFFLKAAMIDMPLSSVYDVPLLSSTTNCKAEEKTSTTRSKRSKLAYVVNNVSVEKYFPKLMADIFQPKYSSLLSPLAASPKIWISNANQPVVTKLQFNQFDSVLVQVKGKSRILLVSPKASTILFQGNYIVRNAKYDPKTNAFSISEEDPPVSQPNYSSFDLRWKDEFVGVSSLQVYECILAPGSNLYIPAHWWHQVVALPKKGNDESGKGVEGGDIPFRHLKASIGTPTQPLTAKVHFQDGSSPSSSSPTSSPSPAASPTPTILASASATLSSNIVIDNLGMNINTQNANSNNNEVKTHGTASVSTSAERPSPSPQQPQPIENEKEIEKEDTTKRDETNVNIIVSYMFESYWVQRSNPADGAEWPPGEVNAKYGLPSSSPS